MKVADLSRVLRAADPGAVLVPAPVLERIIQSAFALPAFLWQVPHRKSLVIDRGLLFRHAEQEELDLPPDQLLPPTVLLLARPAGAPDPVVPTDDTADESHDYFHKLVRSANRARRAGNTVRAAILHTRAARVAPAHLTERTNGEAVKDITVLVRRLKPPLLLSDAEEEQWNRLLPTLLDKADQGHQPVEGAILFDLEKVALDH